MMIGQLRKKANVKFINSHDNNKLQL